MKRILKRITSLESALRFFDVNGELTDVSGLTGNVSGLKGDVSYYLTGDVSGLTGNVSGLTGNVDDAEISKEDRKKGVDISDLIEK